MEQPVAGAAKFEMCVVIRFLHADGQLADLENHFYIASVRSLSLSAPFWYVFSLLVALSLFSTYALSFCCLVEIRDLPSPVSQNFQ